MADGPRTLLDEHNAIEYLRAGAHIGNDEPVTVSRLSGGVSNEVLYVARPESRDGDFVLKQVRPQLRTPQPWFARVDRIWREVEVMRICQEVLDRAADPQLVATTPRLLFEDRENYAFGMSAAPRDHHVWKSDLLEGHTDARVASQCGRLLGHLHAGTWGDAKLERDMSEGVLFDELRLDPYYRSVAAVRPEAAAHFQRLIDSTAEHPRSLVLADFTPKNLLVWNDGLMMVDFETGHYGDPAFDLGLFLAHLMLKAVYRASQYDEYVALVDAFWSSYRSIVEPRLGKEEYDDLIARGIQHLAGCMWARLDGKSRVDYITDEVTRDAIRAVCLKILESHPREWKTVVALFGQCAEMDVTRETASGIVRGSR